MFRTSLARLAMLALAGGALLPACGAMQAAASGAAYEAGSNVVATAASGPAYAPGDDVQWFQADDYLISPEPWKSGWIYVYLAKMRQPATPATKGQAKFFQLSDSKDVWTEHFWRTRPATAADLRVGATVICFEGRMDNDVYGAPTSKDTARTGNWFLGKITDVSDAFKGSYRIDTYNCALGALRVPVQ